MMRRVAFLLGAALLTAVTPSEAQVRELPLRGFADLGATTFAAKQTFNAILGSRSGMVFGGGVEVRLPKRIIASLRASRFRETGQRVFLFEGRQFDLGIPTTITITPLQLTGGYLFDWRWRGRVVPYVGTGIGWYRFRETSSFSTNAEEVLERFIGYHILGGAEFQVRRWVSAAGELQWATVPNAIGDEPNSVAHAFNESDLGGVTFRVKIVVGR